MKRRITAWFLALLLMGSMLGCKKNIPASETEQEDLPAVEEGTHSDMPEAFGEEPLPQESGSAELSEESPSPQEWEDGEPSEEETPLPQESDAAEEQEPIEGVLPVVLPAATEGEELDEQQKNSIAMLNYLAVLSQEINDSKNSRLFLEEAYASLINNTNPEKVNELTESHLCSLLDIIENYRMIDVKRERLQYIYEQNQAKALEAALPNPIGVLGAVRSRSWQQAAAAVVYIALDSLNSYRTYNIETDQEFLNDGWELDDEEAANLHDSRKRAFSFMVEMVREDDLPGELALNENAVANFVAWKNNTNNHQKIQFFESERETYQSFGNYWLTLADCYYENKDYRKCLEAMNKYEGLQTDIFRKDYYFARALPKAIAAANEVYGNQEYVQVAGRYLEQLLANTETSDWALRYFAAEGYLDLYARTDRAVYLKKAYDIALNNVNNLVPQQRSMNAAYLADVKEVAVPAGAVKEEKRKIKEYNKSLKEQRRYELPPVYEPLVLNCELLFALAEKLDVTPAEKQHVEGILRGNGEALFLTEALENQYSFFPKTMAVEAKFENGKDALALPAGCVSEKSVVKVTVTGQGKTTVYDDWTVKEVKRPSGDFSEYIVRYRSEKIGEQKWSDDSTVKVEIFAEENAQEPSTVVDFRISEYKERFWLLPDTIKFEQVR